MARDVLSQAKAWDIYELAMSDERVDFAHEPEGLDSILKALSSGPTPSTKTWNDAYLAAFSIASDISLASFDRGLKRYPGVDLVAIP